ncbi:MAG: redoxin domain-containing protein [Gemmatimonadota bacterium]|nr:MAG: redoxin domain-containing protein [Gemmatimonadota bacterium]
MSLKSILAALLLAAALAVMVVALNRSSSPQALGPADGRDLPRQDLERVALGTIAPNFSLTSLKGDVITLSEFRGTKNVVLVFYRGHW